MRLAHHAAELEKINGEIARKNDELAEASRMKSASTMVTLSVSAKTQSSSGISPWSISTQTTRSKSAHRYCVSAPTPGPISKTPAGLSDGARRRAAAEISIGTAERMRKFCPKPFFGARPYRSSSARTSVGLQRFKDVSPHADRIRGGLPSRTRGKVFPFLVILYMAYRVPGITLTE